MSKTLKLSARIIRSLRLLYPDLPPAFNIEVMRPLDDPETLELVKAFYTKWYQNEGKRVLLLGINPGRFGAGQTGIPFTDPINLEAYSDISNQFSKRHELSSIFIYELIEALGGMQTFHDHFYISSVYPLGLLKKGKNFNYYDEQEVLEHLKPDIIRHISSQLDLGIDREVAYSIGKGKNHRILAELNREEKWFDKVDHIPHPRWVMQYRRKQKPRILEAIVNKLGKHIN